MLIALRDISIGEAVVKRGETISAELQQALPPRRIEQLKGARLVEELTDEMTLSKTVDELRERVSALEAIVGNQAQVNGEDIAIAISEVKPAEAKPGRTPRQRQPRKEAA